MFDLDHRWALWYSYKLIELDLIIIHALLHYTFAAIVWSSFLIPPLDSPDVSFPASIYVAAWSFFTHMTKQNKSWLCDLTEFEGFTSPVGDCHIHCVGDCPGCSP